MERGFQQGDERQIFSNGSEPEDKYSRPGKGDIKKLIKRKRNSYPDAIPQDKSPLKVRTQQTNPRVMARKESETPLATSSPSPFTQRLPHPTPSAQSLERVEAELRSRYKRRRANTPNANKNKNSATDPTAPSHVKLGDDGYHTRSSRNANGNQGKRVARDVEENKGIEKKDSSGHRCNSSKRLGLKQNSPFNKKPKQSLAHASSSSDSRAKLSETQAGHDGSDGKEGSTVESKNQGEESEDRPVSNKYREEFRMRYRQLSRQRKTQATETENRPRAGRTKRTLTGKRTRRVVPTINDSIWRLQYETGCLPGGSNEFLAPKRQDVDVCESLDRAGYVGIGLLAMKLGYHVREMKSLGGYGIDVETDDQLEISWCPPDSEYSRVILTKLPSNSGVWVVDVERGFDYDGTCRFEMPSWRTIGPFENIEDAVAEAKTQMGADRGWEWDRVAMDGAFEIKTDNASGWEGHWNPAGEEYSRVSVKMIGWPETRFEHLCSCKYGYWRRAFGLKRFDVEKEKTIHVEWHESW